MTNDVKVYKVDVYPCGTQYWRLNGQLHREDGPAVITPSGKRLWYLNGKEISEEEHKHRTNPTKELSVAEIEELLGYKVKIVKG